MSNGFSSDAEFLKYTLYYFLEDEDQADVDRAIQLLIQKYLTTKNDVSKRDYIRLM